MTKPSISGRRLASLVVCAGLFLAASQATFGSPALINHTDPVFLAGFGSNRQATGYNDQLWARGGRDRWPRREHRAGGPGHGCLEMLLMDGTTVRYAGALHWRHQA